MKYITGFFMAWGNFFSLPCPLKRWDSKSTSLMLGFLPTIGLFIGFLWALIYFAMVYFGFPYLPVAFVATFLPFALCGFMHLDGFMDCSDAILSRRPLEDRQRILKDSHTGAFAVVSVIFLLLGYFCCIASAVGIGIDFVNLILIAVLSRSVAGLHVLICKPMATSQYVTMSEATAKNTSAEENLNIEGSEFVEGSETAEPAESPKSEKKASKKQGIVLLLIQLVIYAALAFWCSSFYLATALVSVFVIIGTAAAILYGRRQLGGMSGDIAGYGIVWGEFLGAVALMLC